MSIQEGNLTAEMKGNKLLITVDISEKIVKNAPHSTTGKTKLIASSRGNMKCNGGPSWLPEVQIGLNVFVKV